MRFTFRAAVFALCVAACTSEPGVTVPAPRPSAPEGLWTVSGEAAAIIRLDVANTGSTGDVPPATVVTTSSANLRTLAGVAFDRSGTLWIADMDDSSVVAFDQTALSSPGLKSAATVIVPLEGSLSAPSGLAFDRAQRLWVGNHENGTLVRFDVSQLSAGGAQRPAVVITGAGHPTALAFDASGMLWVSDNFSHTISGYSAAQLESSGNRSPAIVLSSSGLSLLNPTGVAFDAAGNLWVANLGNRSVVAFGPDQLLRTGAPLPRRVLLPRTKIVSLPAGLAFDAAGNLWVAGATGFVTRFDRATLESNGSEPSGQFTLPGGSLLWSAAFWPKPVGLPLN